MATMTNPYGMATPIGASLGRLAQVFAQAPGPYERDARAATAEAARALADERRLKIEESRRKTQAYGKIGNLFAQGMAPAPEIPLAEGQMGPNPQMPRDEYVRGLAPQVMSEGLRAGIDDPEKLGQLMFQLFKIGGVSDQQAGQAYPKLIGVNDAVSLPDREAVATRNQQGEIAKIYAKPVETSAGARTDFPTGHPLASGGTIYGPSTESTATGTLINKAAGGEQLTPLAQQIVGAMEKSVAPGAPAKGVPNIRNWVARDPITNQMMQGRTLDGMTDMTTKQPIPSSAQVFTGQVNATDSSGLTRAVQTDLQKSEVATRRVRALLDRTIAQVKQGSGNVGFPGFVKGTLQDAVALAEGVSQSLGYTGATDAVSQIRTSIAANPNIQDRDALLARFDPSLPKLQTAYSVLTYTLAEALFGQSGRGLSNEDVKRVESAIGDPKSFLTSQPQLLARLEEVKAVLDARDAADAKTKTVFGGTSGGAPDAVPSVPGPVVKWGRRADGTLGPLGQ